MWQDITRDEKTLRPCFYVKHAGYDVISSPGNRKKVRIMKNLKEQLMHMVFLLSACVSILCVAMICVFLFANGIPAIGKIGIFQFLAGEKWKPGNNIFGILPMILGSIYVTAGAVLIGVPIGILTAVFMSRFCPKPVYKVVKPAIDLLAGIPSVVYGFFGMVVIVPVVSQLFGGSGKSMLTASILLGIMILPTIIGVSESAINAVPSSYYEGSLALGASHERSVFFATLPAAKSGILPFKIRARQADAVAEEISKAKGDYILVCGDFNDTPISYAHRTVQGPLVDSFAESGQGMGITYNQNMFWFRIDNILHSKNMKSMNCTIDKVRYSDHYPLWCYLSLEE